MIGLSIAIVAWGALAFGAVYPWAYWPLFGAAALTGALAWRGPRGDRFMPADPAFAIALACVAGGMAVQLVPLPIRLLAAISPSTDAILREYNLAYGAGESSRWYALSIDPAATALALAALVSLGIFAVGMTAALSRRGAAGIVNAIVSLGFLLALLAIVQKATGTDRIYGFWEPQDHAFQIFGPFVNRNHFGGWMVMALSVALGAVCARLATVMRRVRPDWRSRALWLGTAEANALALLIFASLVMSLALLLTQSRSAVLCFVVTLAVVGWTVMRADGHHVMRRRLAISYLLVLALAAFAWAGVAPLVERFAAGESLAGRLTAWRAATRIASHFPLTGTGVNTFGTAILFYEPSSQGPHWGAAHNDYLQLAAEGGLLIGLPLITALAVFVRRVRRRFQAANDDVAGYWLRVGAVMGLVAISLQEIVDFSLQLPGIAALFAVLCAIALHAPVAGRREVL